MAQIGTDYFPYGTLGYYRPPLAPLKRGGLVCPNREGPMIFNEPEENLCSSAESVGDKINHPWDTRESSVGAWNLKIGEMLGCVGEKCIFA